MNQISNVFIQNMVDKPIVNQRFVYPNPKVNPKYYQN